MKHGTDSNPIKIIKAASAYRIVSKPVVLVNAGAIMIDIYTLKIEQICKNKN